MNLSTSLLPTPNFEVRAATPDFFRPSLPTRVTLKSSASTFVDANHSPYNDDLLTPPLTNPSLDEPPFHPPESDRTSLSMKRRHGSSHQRRRRHNRACVSSGDVDQTALYNESPRHTFFLSRSRSAPSLTNLLLVPSSRTDKCKKGTLRLDTHSTQEAELAPGRNSLPKHPRRWTMPGKAAPTHVLTSMSPSAGLPEQGEAHSEEEESVERATSVDTPAMITLQRAASGKSRRTSLRPEAYTSFPTPTFSKTRSGFVTTFFGDGWQRSDNTFICASVQSVSIASHNHCPSSSSDRASVDHGNVRPSHSTTASPVCTDVILDPFVQAQITETQPAFRARRCSTKYVSGASTYEIIWDENVSTSSNSGSRRTSTERTRRISMRENDIVPDRRPSMAMDKLEMQLSNEIEQSRKISSACRGRGAIKKVPSTRRSTNRKSFHNMLSFQQAGGDTEAESQRFPRSRASTTSEGKLTGPHMDVHLTTMTGDETSMRHMGFFPPLSSSHTDLDTPNDPLLANPWCTSWETRNDAVPVPPNSAKPLRKGSMIGQGTGMRKKSVYKRTPRVSRKATITRRNTSKPVEEEDWKPLLGQFNNWSDEALPRKLSSLAAGS